MADSEIVLRLGLEPNQNANALVAAEALIAWVALLKEAARAISLLDDVEVDLIGTAKSSLRFDQLLRFVDRNIGSVSEGATDYPHLKKAAIVLALGVAAQAGNVAVQVFGPDQTVSLSDTDRGLLKDFQSKVGGSSAVKEKTKEFFKVVQRDKAISEVGVANGIGEPVVFTIPRSEFPAQSGMWQPATEPAEERAVRYVWDVVLVKAALVGAPRAWGFSRDGLSFSATMQDQHFLAAIAAGTLPITLQEGVQMRVDVEFTERLEGQTWTSLPRTRRIVRVISPVPLSVVETPSLPLPGPPKKG